MNEYQLQAMDRAGETGELPLRNAAPGSSADEDDVYTMDRAADLLESYADFIKCDVMSVDIERHPYLPELEGVARDLRLLARTAAAGERA